MITCLKDIDLYDPPSADFNGKNMTLTDAITQQCASLQELKEKLYPSEEAAGDLNPQLDQETAKKILTSLGATVSPLKLKKLLEPLMDLLYLPLK